MSFDKIFDLTDGVFFYLYYTRVWSCRRRQMRVWGNPRSTRNLQLVLLLLSFVPWRRRQVGARFDGEPSDGNDRSASRQREVLRRQNRVDSDDLTAGNVITCLSVIRIYGDSATTFSTTRHDIQYLWNSYRSYKYLRVDLPT